MLNKKIQSVLLKIVFSLLGLFSFFHIIQEYGLQVIVTEVRRSGFMLVFLVLTFIPTLICFSVSWLLATKHESMRESFIKKVFLFIKYTSISLAWNNMTPFLKIGGEPLKYLMLTKHLSKNEAMASTVNYNMVHLLATAVSFVLTSLLLLFFYKLETNVSYFLLFFSFLFPIFLYLLFHLLHKKVLRNPTKYYFRFLKYLSVNINLSFKRLFRFYKKRPKAFLGSLAFDVAGRFIEGLTFYFGFYLINYPISLKNSAFLDVGRTFLDTAFFFIPFQVGSREEGVRFFLDKVLNVNSNGFLTVVFLYRFVEIVWIIIGYVMWVSGNNSSKEAKV